MITDEPTLAARIEAAVLAVPGVTMTYPVRPRLSDLGTAVRTAVGSRAVDLPRVSIDAEGVRVAIGTDGVTDARVVVQAVQVAVAALLRAGDGAIDVKVARIG